MNSYYFKRVLMFSLAFLLVFGTPNAIAANIKPTDVTKISGLSAVTSIGIKPGTSIRVKNSEEFATKGQTLEFNLLDINGNPISVGNFTGSVTLNGPAVFEHNKQKAELVIRKGKGFITFYVTNCYYPGEITVIPNFRGLLNKPFIEELYIPGLTGNATQVLLSPRPIKTTYSINELMALGDIPFLTYNLQAVDLNGYPTATNAPVSMTANVTLNGRPSSQVVATPQSGSNGSSNILIKLKNVSPSSQLLTGTYRVTITAKAAGETIFAPLSETFTIITN